MNSSLAQKFKPSLVYVLALAMVGPSLIWIALDKSVWGWDEAIYAKGSVDLFYVLVHSPERWLRRLNIPQSQAPGVSWLGQFFVPLGYILGSIDIALLISIILTQALTLLLMYRAFRELSDRNELIAVTGCLVIASASLFVAMSHRYFTEPLQLFAVSWFVLIMAFAPKWNRAFTLSQLLVATPVAMVAKVSSPLYCAGPALVALWYICRPAGFPTKSGGNKITLGIWCVAGLLLNFAAIRWYSRNINRVIEHVVVSSSGPFAEVYGKADTLLNTMLRWVGSLRNNFFLPTVFVLVSALCSLAVILYLIRKRPLRTHFTTCTLVALLQTVIVLSVFSFSPSREVRYILPLLPYVVLVICWSLAQIGSRTLTGLTIICFLVQYASTYSQALGLVEHTPTTPGWLTVPNRASAEKESIALDAIVAKTCSDIRSRGYLNMVGIEKPWLNEHSANYLASKNRVLYRPVACHYGSFGYETDPDRIWNHVVSNVRYYITVDPDSNPVPSEDAHLKAINQNYLPTLERVQNSALFELEPPLPEDPAVWIFRRVTSSKGR
jgi:hypothetical protein